MKNNKLKAYYNESERNKLRLEFSGSGGKDYLLFGTDFRECAAVKFWNYSSANRPKYTFCSITVAFVGRTFRISTFRCSPGGFHQTLDALNTTVISEQYVQRLTSQFSSLPARLWPRQQKRRPNCGGTVGAQQPEQNARYAYQPQPQYQSSGAERKNAKGSPADA
eukprot:gene747-395_t